MGSIIDQRHDIVKNAVMQRPDAVVEVTILMWERLAVELISIIGEEGFQSLYARSCHLNSAIFPWLLLDHSSSSSDSRFVDLQICLENREPAEASEASKALFITFVDILALLISDLLTASILRSAWIDDTFELVAKGNTQ
ncbi:hypothetical protein [Undibacterium sp. Ren11W]|uniref:hypothetical protein n=1 Tax=Undibacterium sp. Ren11W TaxID=3413045 RepID=UPI003BF2DFD7